MITRNKLNCPISFICKINAQVSPWPSRTSVIAYSSLPSTHGMNLSHPLLQPHTHSTPLEGPGPSQEAGAETGSPSMFTLKLLRESVCCFLCASATSLESKAGFSSSPHYFVLSKKLARSSGSLQSTLLMLYTAVA